ncbi:protein LYK5 [Typha angustifolia]|uniref:protein LYK5 n=1 Tax=Typha angustifolia TaxID=59011 RepID=UPI003C2BBE98
MMKHSSPSGPPILSLLFVMYLQLCGYYYWPCQGQQDYEDNKQLDCDSTNASSTLGYACDGGGLSNCTSYLTFRSHTPYTTPVTIAYLFSANASNISAINAIPDVNAVSTDDLVLVPIPCSCTGNNQYYQHNATYTIKYDTETYFIIANDTYQGLTTCQALIAQNPSHNSRNLTVGLQLQVPVRCACPSANQTAAGFRYLLTYLVTWGDDVPTITQRFRSDYQAVLDANNLTSDSTIYPFTTLLIPLKTPPTKSELVTPTPPAPQPTTDNSSDDNNSSSNDSDSSKKWVFVGVGIGVGLLLLCGIAGGLICCFYYRRPDLMGPVAAEPLVEGDLSGVKRGAATSVVSNDIRNIIDSLTVYKYQELERATESFGEDHRIKGSAVYRGVINGDEAAIKRLKGDVSHEINILQHINHSNVVRLSGFCLHQGNTYLVYEFAQKGSLADCLHHNHHNLNGNLVMMKSSSSSGSSKEEEEDLNNGNYYVSSSSSYSSNSSRVLSWKQRVQIAHDVADGLNYLHNYTNPPYIHKNLKSSNILIDADFRAKLSNFGLARALLIQPTEEDSEEGGSPPPQLTRHVVGTQGYMAPEYLEHGLMTPQLDVFAFGVVMLELLSGKEATFSKTKTKTKKDGEKKNRRGSEALLWESIGGILSGEDAKSKLRGFMDPCLQRSDYPLDLAYAMAELAMRCVSREAGSRPTMAEVLVSLSAIYNSALDWDPSDYSNSGSMAQAR